MKHLTFLIILFVYASAGKAQSQQTVCGIFYSYDANGERIQRKYNCIYDGPAHPTDKPLYGVIYPNPTAGPFAVELNEFVLSVVMTVSNINGEQLSSVSRSQCWEISGDISPYAP